VKNDRLRPLAQRGTGAAGKADTGSCIPLLQEEMQIPDSTSFSGSLFLLGAVSGVNGNGNSFFSPGAHTARRKYRFLLCAFPVERPFFP
jgi:hypothetical protein